MKRSLAGLAAILALHVAARWPFRRVPLVRDEGEYVHMVQEVARGAAPYLDVYNQKTPVVFGLVAGFQALLGRSVEALRLGTTLFGAATALAVFGCARRLRGTAAGLWAAGAFCVMGFDQAGIVHPTSTEYFLLGWTALGAWCWYAARDRPWLALLAGVGAGLACQTKQSGLFVLLFFAAEAAWRWAWGPARGRLLRRGAAALGLAALGFAAVWAVTLAWLASHGAVAAYLEAAWANNLEYVGARHGGPLGVARTFLVVLERVPRWDAGLWALGAASLGVLAVRAPRSEAGSAWILLAGALGAGLGTGGFYVHYWEPLIVPLALGVGAGCAWLARAAAAAGGPRRAALAALLVLPWLPPAAHVAASLRDPSATVARAVERLPPMGDAQAVAAELAARTAPDEPVLVIGSEPQIYWYADRPSSTRFSHTYLLTGDYSFAPALRRAFFDELRRDGPRWVLMVDLHTSLSEYPRRARDFAERAHEVLRQRYTLEAAFPEAGPRGPGGYLKLYRRLPDPGGAQR